MAFIFTCGTHTFTSALKGYENVVVRCQNCGNVSARCYKRWEWFTFCFVPVIPFSLKPYHDVGCYICNFYQDMKYRPDVPQPQGIEQYQMQPPGAQVPQGPPQPKPDELEHPREDRFG